MQEFRIAYIVKNVDFDIFIAESIDDARKQWEDQNLDAELLYIMDEDGNQVVYD